VTAFYKHLLKGISTGDFSEALQSLLGEGAPNLSPNVVVRLKEQWGQEYDQWSRRDLSEKQYVYVWADGIHVNVRLENEANQRQCLLVLMGATAGGAKELMAVVDGYRESEQSWYELLINLRNRGLALAPKLAVGDGALGFSAALRKIFGETQEQRC
jgi:putative transposase